jgi:hypothetical protein
MLRPAEEELAKAEDGGEGVIEIVGDAAGHAAEGVEALPLDDVLLGLAEFLQRVGELAVALEDGGLGPFALPDFLLELLIGGDELGGAICDATLQLVAGALEFVLGFLALEGVAQGADEEAIIDAALYQIILGTALHGLDGEAFVIHAGEDDDGDVRRAILDAEEGLEALAIGECEIEQDGVDAGELEQIEAGAEGGDVGYLEDGVVALHEEALKQLGVLLVILDQQDMDVFVCHRGRTYQSLGSLTTVSQKSSTPLTIRMKSGRFAGFRI